MKKYMIGIMAIMLFSMATFVIAGAGDACSLPCSSPGGQPDHQLCIEYSGQAGRDCGPCAVPPGQDGIWHCEGMEEEETIPEISSITMIIVLGIVGGVAYLISKRKK